MDGSIQLSSRDRKTLLRVYRSGTGVRSRRAHVILLAAQGWSVRDIRAGTFTSFDFICNTLRTYRDEGLEAVTDEPPAPPLPEWAALVAEWLAHQTPEDFGFFRRRWSCELVATVLAKVKNVRRSPMVWSRRLRSRPNSRSSMDCKRLRLT